MDIDARAGIGEQIPALRVAVMDQLAAMVDFLMQPGQDRLERIQLLALDAVLRLVFLSPFPVPDTP